MNLLNAAKGLPPLPEPTAQDTAASTGDAAKGNSEAKTAKTQGLSFSSGSAAKGRSAKRKAVGDGRDDIGKPETSTKGTKKKPKKQEKKLLSFDEDA